MGKKVLNILILLSMIVIIFFIKIRDVMAVTECTWYTYESGIYYDESAKKYKPVRTYIGNTMTYELDFKDKNGRDFTLTRSDKKFFDNDTRNQLLNNSICPDYIGVAYYRSGINDYSILQGNSTDYKNYIQKQYENAIIDSDYSTVEVSGLLDESFHIEANDKKDDEEATPIYFTRVETSYKEGLKLDKYDQDLAEKIKNALTGLKDKGKSSHTKQQFYEQTRSSWLKAIDQVYSELKSNCSTYSNPYSKNRESYLDLIDNDVFNDMLNENTISPYSNYSSKIPTEECYNTVINAKFMQASFINWFNLVDWIVLTEDDDKNDFSTYYKYYEFSHLQTEGGQHVRSIREMFNEREIGNKNHDDKIADQNDKCRVLCHDYNNISIAYEQCLQGKEIDMCRNVDNTCTKKCKSNNNICYTNCMKNGYGEEKYNKLIEKYNNLQSEYDETISDSLTGMSDELNNIKIPIEGIEFKPYKAKCEDVVMFHTIYMIMVIAAPILTLLFGVIDFTKSVLASDEKKILEFRKKFPKRLLLLMLFILVPLIISFILNLVGGDTSLMNCVINGE